MIKIVVAACVLILGAAGLPTYLTAGDLPKIVGQDGSIERPGADFRRDWSHLGSWAVLDKDSAAHGIHDVYATRVTVDAFRATGKYPDGAVLVKEIRSFETGQLTTGNVAYAGSPAVWFVMVKDGVGPCFRPTILKSRSPNPSKHPVWGVIPRSPRRIGFSRAVTPP